MLFSSVYFRQVGMKVLNMFKKFVYPAVPSTNTFHSWLCTLKTCSYLLCRTAYVLYSSHYYCIPGCSNCMLHHSYIHPRLAVDSAQWDLGIIVILLLSRKNRAQMKHFSFVLSPTWIGANFKRFTFVLIRHYIWHSETGTLQKLQFYHICKWFI